MPGCRPPHPDTRPPIPPPPPSPGRRRVCDRVGAGGPGAAGGGGLHLLACRSGTAARGGRGSTAVQGCLYLCVPASLSVCVCARL